MSKLKASTLSILTEFEVYASEKSLKKSESDLLTAAKLLTKDAYAPYSNFQVGAAVLLDNGKIITGNNQENAAYPDGLCAERVALFYAKAQYPKATVVSIAITAKPKRTAISEPITPCGSCRQVIAEYESTQKKPIRIIMSSPKGKIYIAKSIESLLPLMFNQKHL